MGWFDKKSWQLRRKIRDLQSELAMAEREGKYVVAQGLFFAELEEMGDATMMVLGTADHLDSEEGAMIKTFFERNGFSVETLRLDRSQKSLAAVEIIPPEELTRRVAKAFRDKEYRLIDDSDKERLSSLDNQIVTLSCLIRSISSLFASHVHHLIVTSPLKMNMEGNRLLHWLPLIRDELASRVPPELITLCREPFVDAYNHYYGRFGQMESFATHDIEDHPAGSPDEMNQSLQDFSPQNSTDTGSTPWAAADASEAEELFHPPTEDTSFNHTPSRGSVLTSEFPVKTGITARELEAAHTVARMYRSLIGASDQRKPRNSEMLLEYVGRFFNAKAACILARSGDGNNLILIANSGGISCVKTDAEGAVSCASNTLEKCLTTHSVVIGQPTNGNSNPAAVAAPLLLESALDAVLYLVEPEGFKDDDAEHLMQFAQIFREFPDLLISPPIEKKGDTSDKM